MRYVFIRCPMAPRSCSGVSAMGRRAREIVLSEEERAELQRWRRRRSGSSGLYVRAGIVLDCAAGLSGAQIAERHRTSQQTVTKWRRRFASGRLAGLSDAPRSGQPRRHGDERVQEVLDATLNRRPGNATHWSVRSLSAELGVPRGLRASGLAGVWPEAPSVAQLQAVDRSALRGEGARCRRPLPGSAGQGAGAVRGREEPDPGAGADATVVAAELGHAGDAHPRLPALRHDDAVRGLGRSHGQGHRPAQAPPPQHRLHRLPAAHRPGRPRPIWRST